MKGLFIPEITAQMFRDGCLESIEALMAEGQIYDIEYDAKWMQWIPVKTRPMTQEERKYYETDWGVVLNDEEAVLFDCKMPEDKQTIWVTTKNGYLFQDTCENDDGYIGLEGNGDWYDIVAWMPVLVPEPYKESEE